MGTIFVAYGESGQRVPVLEFAAEQAAASEHELFVYHIQANENESERQIREEVETVIGETAPAVSFSVSIDTPAKFSDSTNISNSRRILDAIFESDTDYEYVVMGVVQRDALEGLIHPSLTEAVLETHAIPVMLVPV